uniref:Chlorophyllase n=1 Tax=Alexandrium catenella TaxID=2925 RepID=A0A7S1ML74_ALECA|mmetsp:Transcript_27698/g.75097  ORF Transcript_27698/g.75097 Transcript_27698/m.75097 type:complete len:345 (+) Transcript_27698:100-1134(+)
MVALALAAGWLLSSLSAARALRIWNDDIDGTKFRVISIPYRYLEADNGKVTDLPKDLSMGTLMAYEPVSPANKDLFLFLAGSGATCAYYSYFLEVIGTHMHTLCVPYDNREAIAFKCWVAGRECYAKVRHEALDGNFNGVPNNNIEDRLVSALHYLVKHESKRWKAFVDASNVPRWGSLRVAGHSQGAGTAAMMGYMHKVSRVLQLSGICDRADWPERAPPATPSDRWFAFGHDLDRDCPVSVQRKHWQAEGALKEGAEPLRVRGRDQITSEFLGDAHAVVSHIAPPGCAGGAEVQGRKVLEGRGEVDEQDFCGEMAHRSVCGNVWLNEKCPYAKGLWQSLAGI